MIVIEPRASEHRTRLPPWLGAVQFCRLQDGLSLVVIYLVDRIFWVRLTQPYHRGIAFMSERETSPLKNGKMMCMMLLMKEEEGSSSRDGIHP